MIQLTQGGAYLVNGTDIVADTPEAASQIQAKTGITISKEEAAKNTMAYGILQAVKVVSGALAEFDGVVAEVSPESGKVKVLVTIFGRETPVELSFDQVARI